MDTFYEESSISRDKKGALKYKVTHVISNVFLTLGIVGLIFGFNFIPVNGMIAWSLFCLWFFVVWFVLFKFKARFNVTYDYCFVSGELRISKVINVNKRKLLVRLQSDDIIQIGDVDNQSFVGLRADPNTKLVFCTSNERAMEGKFFLYILANVDGKKLYVLECREELLLQMMRFLKRSVLESDYVMQEKKNGILGQRRNDKTVS